MRILNWVQSKISGRNESRRSDANSAATSHYRPVERKEEFSDWPNGLLAIGTFGNGDFNGEQQTDSPAGKPCLSQEFPDFTMEEVTKLQRELAKLLSAKPQPPNGESETEEKNLPLDRFLNCPSTLEIDRKDVHESRKDIDDLDGGELLPNGRIVPSRGNALKESNRDIKQRSLSFLLKKMFACRGGFGPMPSLRDPIPESRTEKLLKALFHKKIHPHGSAPVIAKKYLQNKPSNEKDKEEKIQKNAGCASKWVKTDSECGSAPVMAKKYLQNKPSNEKDKEEKIQKNAGCASKWVKTDSEYIVLEI